MNSGIVDIVFFTNTQPACWSTEVSFCKKFAVCIMGASYLNTNCLLENSLSPSLQLDPR